MDGELTQLDLEYLFKYGKPLPEGTTEVRFPMFLGGYPHPLPESLVVCDYLGLNGYKHPLPAGLERCRNIEFDGFRYTHEIPDTLRFAERQCCFFRRIKGTLPKGMYEGVTVPVIEDIHRKVYEAVKVDGALNMEFWHACETTHCRAGWVVTLAGEAGLKLEREVGTSNAASMIYMASDPEFMMDHDLFTTDDEEAMRQIKMAAGVIDG